jgi:hypothetical protein
MEGNHMSTKKVQEGESIETLYQKVLEIIISPDIDMYLIGLTNNPDDRREEYFNAYPDAYNFLWPLESGLTYEAVKQKNIELFNFLVRDKRSITYLKYHQDKRDKPCHPRYGRTKHESYVLHICGHKK